MFDYIKKQIAEQMKSNEDTQAQINENNENDLILECTQLLEELEELSVEGQPINEFRDIDALSFSLEEDPELESFEISMSDGRILDMPGDILVHSESYEPMQSREDFRQIAESEIHQGMMSEDEYNDLITEFVENAYTDYMSTIFQEGVFSAQKLDIKDSSIPWTRVVEFGPSDLKDTNSRPHSVRLPIAYEKLAFNQILLKQKDSIQMIVDNNANVFTSFGTRYTELLSKNGYTIPDDMSIWDIVTPNLIMVPVEPVDSFALVIRAENKLAKTGGDKFIYISISMAIADAKKDSSSITDIINLDKTPKFASKVVDSIGLVKESMKPTPILGRSIQEGIEFTNQETETPPDPDGDSNDNGGGDAVGGDNGGDAKAEENPDAQKTESNDIAPDIAASVKAANDEEQNKEADDSGDNGDAVDSGDDSAVAGDGLDTATTDQPEDDTEIPDETNAEVGDEASSNETDIDSELNALDDMGNTDSEMDTNIGDMNIEDMTPNQLTQAAAQKIKDMTLNQIKSFLQNDDPDSVATTEAFILTRKNINAELDATIRKCLGDLNDTTQSASAIMKDFKKDGKKLNKALSKAAKMDDVYNESERQSLIKLNKCLADLMVSFREGMNTSEVQVVKRLIKAFVAQAQGVGKIIDKHKNDTFQEEVEPETDEYGLPIREI